MINPQFDAPKHRCANFQCDREAIVILRWKDRDGHKCFARFCEEHALAAYVELYQEHDEDPTIEDLVKDAHLPIKGHAR